MVINKSMAKVEFVEFDWSADRYLKDGTTIPADGFAMLARDFDAILVVDEGVETILAQDADAMQLVNYTRCKEQGLGDVFLLSAAAIRKFPTMCRVDVFDYDKHTSKPKGVVEVTL